MFTDSPSHGCKVETINVVPRVACWSFVDGALGGYRIAADEVPSQHVSPEYLCELLNSRTK
jgi:hypothetical protein